MTGESNQIIVCWGVCDFGKPRNRIGLQGLKANGVTVIMCHRNLWQGIEDKTQISGLAFKLKLALRWLLAYPVLWFKYFTLPKHKTVLVGYPGALDVLLLWPFAKLRGAGIVWDVFFSVYDTVVRDRKLLKPSNPLAWFIFLLEWLAARAASKVVLDTETHAGYFAETFGLGPSKMAHVPVGVETEFFPSSPVKSLSTRPLLLFYGQCIPLHGMETIVGAARLAGPQFDWLLIGDGQEAAKIRNQLKQQPLDNLKWEPWAPYHELQTKIRNADLVLGIFGQSAKAANVVPNKVFQAFASGKPVLTRHSPAILEWVSPETEGVFLVPPGNPSAIVDAVHKFCRNPPVAGAQLHGALREKLNVEAVGRVWKSVLVSQ